jgi:hypothetical protein
LDLNEEDVPRVELGGRLSPPQMPDGCDGRCPTKDEARHAIEKRFAEFTAGMSKEDVYDRMMKGIRASRSRPS